MVGSAIMRNLQKQGFSNIVTRTSAELDLRNQQAVADFFAKEKPEYVFLAAAKVGGIQANNTYRADFIYENLMIQNIGLHIKLKMANLVGLNHQLPNTILIFQTKELVFRKAEHFQV